MLCAVLGSSCLPSRSRLQIRSNGGQEPQDGGASEVKVTGLDERTG